VGAPSALRIEAADVVAAVAETESHAAVAVLTAPSPEAHAAVSEPESAPRPAPVPASTPESLADASPDPDPEPPDMDYPADPDEPDIATLQALAAAPPRPAADEEPEIVAVQESPAALARLWPRLLGELMSTRPLLATQMRSTRLEWLDEGTPTLRLVVLDRSSHHLLADDNDFRKSIIAFLGTKLKSGADFPFRIHLDEAAAAAPEGAAPLAAAEEDHGEEHIIAFIRDLFEGRTIG
jgi:hypothetical protein